MKHITIFTSALLLALTGCGGSSENSDGGNTASVSSVGIFLDKEVEGLEYQSNSYSGKTDSKGYFRYKLNENVTFKIGNTTLGTKKMESTYSVVTPLELVGTNDVNDIRVVNILRVLQTADSDHNASNGITITKQPSNDIIDISKINKDFNN